MKKYYAVKIGRKPGIYESWEECEKQIHNYSGAKYKKFTNKIDAQKFMNAVSEKEQPVISNNDTDILVAYVDGSYKNNMFGVGCVCISNNVLYKFKTSGEDIFEMQNVTGELYAAIMAVRFAISRGYKRIRIMYDYYGIEAWVTREWKSKNCFTQKYVKIMDELSQNIIIEFNKVKAHSGDFYNCMADKLAKESLEEGS